MTRRHLLLVAVLLVLVLGATMAVSNRIVSWLWLTELGFGVIFWRILGAQVLLFSVAGVITFTYAWLNLRRCLGPGEGGPRRIRIAIPDAGETEVTLPQLRGAATTLAVVLALLFAGAFYGSWDEYLLFRWHQPFGQTDVVFGRDLGFYFFRLPFLEILQNHLVALTGLVLGAVVVLGVLQGTLSYEPGRGLQANRQTARHASVCFLLFLASWAWGYYLDRYQLLFSAEGAVYGAGYTDVHVLRYALWGMVAASVVLGALVAVGMVRRRVTVSVAGIGVYVALAVAAMRIWPGVVQNFMVQPNELELETPYIERAIAATRSAYGLDRIEERDYPALDDLTFEATRDNRETLRNVRLWDWRPLTQTYRQMQEIRSYYQFYEVDVDRYRLDGAYRQVMLSARELGQQLPERADTWVNRVLQFTHGYGLAMSLATQEGTQGVPEYLIKDLPPVSTAGLEVRQPAIYYGEKMTGYRLVDTGVEELDYPKGDANVYTSYAGEGGVPIDSLWKRLLFAWELGELNVLLTRYITPDSRIQLWRRVQERIGRIAPFLQLDPDPYLVLSEGRLFWIQDAYTTSSRFPYSEPHRGQFNYIRNSVKIVVDAYHGSVEFYVMDPEDPVLQVYRQAFPGVFHPLEELGAPLRAHLRYPTGLFSVQAEKLGTYHMTAPQVYYNREDLWTVPQEKYAGSAIQMEPYYILMRLPEEDTLEFLLMLPLTPSNRDNMIAWLAARCDFPDYGKLLVYKLPKERLIYGPLQIEAMIDQDTRISQQLSLWDQRGSQVIRGNLLVIPIDRSFLYVEPVYLIAEGTDIPQLRRVIVAYGDRVAMEPTLESAIRAVFGAESEAEEAPATTLPVGGALPEVRQAFQRAQEALRAARWREFGEAMEEVKNLLRGESQQ